MRIAIIGSRGLPAGIGGVEHVVEELTRELSARGHEVLVHARRGYLRAWPSRPQADGVRVIPTPGMAGKHTDTITHTATAMWDVLRRRVDVVHVFSPGPALLSFLPRAAGLPVVLTIQGPDWAGARWSRPARWALLAGLGCGMRCASEVSAVSLSLRDFLADKYAREVQHIPNGVRPARYGPPRTIGRWGLKPQEYALFVGRIVPGKGVDLLVRAWRVLGTAMPLVIVGAAPGERDYAARCRREAPASVRFVGPRFGGCLAELYSNAALVVQPSRAEGMSLVLLEAAAHGRCVVARDIPANREALGEAMAAFREDSAEALAEAIGTCLSDGALRERIGQSARGRVIQRFGWAGIAGKYEELYRRAVLARRRP